ncbi:MAG: adenine-specific methyltransferase EcoRI family protein [Candidatus Paceibacterota bacterium]|jgi:hypothetical protein
MANKNLTNAKKAKNDEFYTQFSDIQKEVESYLEYDPNTFKGKVVYSNCDDPFESNFFRYFVLNFNKLGLKQLITTSYKPSPIANMELELIYHQDTVKNSTKSKGRPKVTANKFIINEVGDVDGDGSFTLEDIAQQLRANKNNEWTPLEGDGDFMSDECVELLKQSDIVVTNPPFSLFKEYIKQLFDYNKKFVIIGNMNAITYKEVFPKIKENKMWLGATGNGNDMVFAVPNGIDIAESDRQKAARLGYVGDYTRLGNSCWFTNLDHGRRHKPLSLMTEIDIIKFSAKKPFEKYDNYKALEVSFVKNIPSDYEGVMGVPISFLDKYNPEQFEILGATESEGRGFSDGLWNESSKVSQPLIGGERVYKRIFIKHKKVKK